PGFKIGDSSSFFFSVLPTTDISFSVLLDNVTVVREPFHSLAGGYLTKSIPGISISRQPYLIVNLRGNSSEAMSVLLEYSLEGWKDIGKITLLANHQYTYAILDAQSWEGDSVVSGIALGLDSTSNSSRILGII